MIRRDMAEVLAIDFASFKFPWIDADFIRCLRQRNCIGQVAEYDGRVVGYFLYELHRTRIRVLRLAVASDYLRLMVGSQMVAKLIAKLSEQRRHQIMLEIRETNLDGQFFFRANGFQAVYVARQFYADTGEDAYVMRYRHRADNVR
jgi:ribosomal-protein-alanine N-acetyltransferase